MPSRSKRISSNRFLPRPERWIVFRNCFGMIISVSILTSGMGAAMPVSVLRAVPGAEIVGVDGNGVVDLAGLERALAA